MANIINNTDLDKISQTVANGKRDKESLRRPVKLKGEWNLDPTKGYQFRTELSFEKGKGVIEIDSPKVETEIGLVQWHIVWLVLLHVL